MDQFVVLTAIGALITIVGLAMFLAKKRGGGVVLLLGLLWLFTMALYYGLNYVGTYGKPSPVNNAIGLAILVIGGGVAIYYISSYRKKAARGG
ncbi:MAG: hypothetical protein ABWK00_01820 [Desulfurococcaceae archaeon]